MTSKCKQSRLPHRFSPGSKLFFVTAVGWLTCWVGPYDSCDMEHAAPRSVLRASGSANASSGLPGLPAGCRGKDVRIHNDSARYSTAAQQEVASLCLYICYHHFLYISILCWRHVFSYQLNPNFNHPKRTQSSARRLGGSVARLGSARLCPARLTSSRGTRPQQRSVFILLC